MKNEMQRSIKEYIDSIVTPIFAEKLRISTGNEFKGMTSNALPPKGYHKIVWRPNNYRRQMEVKDLKLSPREIELHSKPPSSISYGNLISIKNFRKGITIQLGRNTATAIYSQPKLRGSKKIYIVEGDPTEISLQITKKVDQIKTKLDKALFDFCRPYGLAIPFKVPIWSRHEDFIKNEAYIDNLPEDLIMHDTIFKKVYGRGIEFKNNGLGDTPGVYAKNYINNRAIDQIEPLILKEISKTGAMVMSYIRGLHYDLNKRIDQIEKGYQKEDHKKDIKNRSLKEWEE